MTWIFLSPSEIQVCCFPLPVIPSTQWLQVPRKRTCQFLEQCETPGLSVIPQFTGVWWRGVLPPRFRVLLINVWPVPLECKNSCVSGSFSPFYVPLYHKLQHHIHLFTSCSFQIGRGERACVSVSVSLLQSLEFLYLSPYCNHKKVRDKEQKGTPIPPVSLL